jgi:hypothetical protein
MYWISVAVGIVSMTVVALFLVYWISILESFADKQFSATACWPSSGINMSVKRR